MTIAFCRHYVLSVIIVIGKSQKGKKRHYRKGSVLQIRAKRNTGAVRPHDTDASICRVPIHGYTPPFF